MREHLRECENYLKNFKNKFFLIIIDIALIRVKVEIKNQTKKKKFSIKKLKSNQQTLNYIFYNDI